MKDYEVTHSTHAVLHDLSQLVLTGFDDPPVKSTQDHDPSAWWLRRWRSCTSCMTS